MLKRINALAPTIATGILAFLLAAWIGAGIVLAASEEQRVAEQARV